MSWPSGMPQRWRPATRPPRRSWSATVACIPRPWRVLGDDLEARLHHLRVPINHRRYVRTTNLIERSFLEERRRTKVIPRFFDERSCLKLVFATLQRASQRWQRVRITELEQKQLLVLRHDLGLNPDPVPTRRASEERAA